jgi:methionine synthase II (cobalamin-independent)
MTIPTEPIGSIPRPFKLLDAINRLGSSHPSLEPLYDEAIRDTIEQFEATGSPVVTDGEQRKYHNFATYCVEGLPNTAPDGFKLRFAAGHTRRWPRLTGGPFRFLMYGYDFLDRALKYAHVPVKQAVVSPSALSLMYPAENLPGYSRDEFIEDLLGEHEKEIRGCFAKGAHMPGEDGYSLIRRLRAIEKIQENALPAVALSAYARTEDRTKSIRAGFQNHLAKPVEPSELLAIVGSLAGRTAATSDSAD